MAMRRHNGGPVPVRRICDLADEAGVALIEATLGTCLLIFAALVVVQIVLGFHGRISAHEAAMYSARRFSLTRDLAKVQEDYDRQRATSLRALVWKDQPTCSIEVSGQGEKLAVCVVELRVPVVIPGAALIGSGGWIPYTGSFPVWSQK
jgi:hypothetical protein